MSGVNKVILIGRLGKDPEVYTFAIGDKQTSFSLSTSDSYINKSGEKVEDTEWHNVVIKGKAAEIVQKHFSKGSQIYVEGSLKTRKWEKDGDTKYITEVVCWNFEFIGSKSSNESSISPELQGQQEPEWVGAENEQGDDLPF
jgi:single-strand DNA-binding protein